MHFIFSSFRIFYLSLLVFVVGMAGAQCCARPLTLDGGSGGGAVVDVGGLRCCAVGREWRYCPSRI